MCIRDSPTPAYGISTGFGALATRHIPVEQRAQLQRSLAVSYTHLRAHETVLDLVCRLLLEKKTNIKSNLPIIYHMYITTIQCH